MDGLQNLLASICSSSASNQTTTLVQTRTFNRTYFNGGAQYEIERKKINRKWETLVFISILFIFGFNVVQILFLLGLLLGEHHLTLKPKPMSLAELCYINHSFSSLSFNVRFHSHVCIQQLLLEYICFQSTFVVLDCKSSMPSLLFFCFNVSLRNMLKSSGLMLHVITLWPTFNVECFVEKQCKLCSVCWNYFSGHSQIIMRANICVF